MTHRIVCAVLVAAFTVTIVSPRIGHAGEKLAETLVFEAEKAVVQTRLGLAVPLLEGAWEIGRDPETLWKLARAYTMVGQYQEALDRYRKLRSIKGLAPELARRTKVEIERLANAQSLYGDEILKRRPVTAHAQVAFKLGRALALRKRYEPAIRYLRGALHLDPTLPGAYRVLAGVYGTLGKRQQEQRFFLDYLKLRPDGALADKIRARLAPQNVLAAVSLRASYPCDVWVNGRSLGRKTPIDGLLLPPGGHTVVFVNEEHKVIRYRHVRLSQKAPLEVTFDYGLLKVALKPWARVRANGKDLGLWPALGLPVGRYDLELKAFDGSHSKSLSVRIKKQQVVTVDTW